MQTSKRTEYDQKNDVWMVVIMANIKSIQVVKADDERLLSLVYMTMSLVIQTIKSSSTTNYAKFACGKKVLVEKIAVEVYMIRKSDVDVTTKLTKILLYLAKFIPVTEKCKERCWIDINNIPKSNERGRFVAYVSSSDTIRDGKRMVVNTLRIRTSEPLSKFMRDDSDTTLARAEALLN